MDASWWSDCHWSSASEVIEALIGGAVIQSQEDYNENYTQFYVVQPETGRSRNCTVSDKDAGVINEFVKCSWTEEKVSKVRRRIEDALRKSSDIELLIRVAIMYKVKIG